MKKLVLFICLLVATYGATIAQQISPKVSVQGTLKDANGVTAEDGVYTVTFKLYEQAEGGTAIWEETADVEVAGGIYSHLLGSVTPLVPGNFRNILFLGITVNGLELSPRGELTYSPYSLATIGEGCTGAVGDIKYSILNPTQFAQVNGDCWVPVDGRDITDSQLAGIISQNTLPDIGGTFIRSMEWTNGADRDPDRTANSAVGTFQGDTYKSHNHSMESAGDHNHQYEDSFVAAIVQWTRNGSLTIGSAFQNRTANNGNGESISNNASGSEGVYLNQALYSGTTPNSGSHSHTINSSGSSETRPENFNFYVYIRIN